MNLKLEKLAFEMTQEREKENKVETKDIKLVWFSYDKDGNENMPNNYDRT